MITVKRKINKSELLDFFYNKMDKNDPMLYEEMNGSPLNVFQLTASVGAIVSKRVRPRNLEELTACNALARPGTVNSLEDYALAKDEGFTKYKNEIIQNCLKDSYNIILYQEQIMSLFNIIGGFTLEETNEVRGVLKKLSKKEKKQCDIDEWANNVVRFKKNATALNIPAEEVDLLVKDMEALAQYSFNKSHAISYAAMAVMTLYFSKYFKEFWYSSVVEYKMNKERNELIDCFKTISANNYSLAPPSINESKERTYAKNNKIIIGLHNIKGIGSASEAIISHAPYDSFIDFYIKNSYEKTVRKPAVSALVKFGSFDEAEGLNRKQMISAFKIFWDNKKTVSKSNGVSTESDADGIISLIKAESPKEEKNVILWNRIKSEVKLNPQLFNVDNNELKEFEFESFGFNYFISPFSYKMKEIIYEKERKGLITSSLVKLFEVEKTSRIVPVYISAIREKNDKNNNEMGFLTVEDVDGYKAVIPLFSSIYGSLKSRVAVGKICMMLLFSKYSDFSKSKQIMFGTDSYVTSEKAVKFVIPIKEPV